MDDPRFARIKKDPKFKALSKKNLKVKLNQKFKQVLTNPKFSTKPKFDVYGNRNTIDQNDEYKEHFDVEEDDAVNDSLEEEHSEQINSSENQSVNDSSIQLSEGVDKWEEDEIELQHVPQITKATRRLAMQNYDWTQIKAQEIMVLFSSFLPQDGIIKCVKVYQSEFGKQKMAEEQQYGPRSIFRDNAGENEQDDNQDAVISVNQLIVKANDKNIDIDPDKLREYEKDRLKYYYAVIEFNSAKIADHVYQQTNGQEFELSNLKIDLRFIADDVQLPESNLESKCDVLPSKLQLKNYINRASGHTDVKLTWEEQENRTNFWSKNPKALNEQDWQELMGEGQSDEENKDKLRDLLEKAIEEEDDDDWRDQFKKKSKSNIKVTFSSGFNMNGQNSILDKEQLQKKKHYGPKQGNTDDFFIGFNEDQNNGEEEEEQGERKTNYKERKQQRMQKLKEKKREQAELELLVERKNKSSSEFKPNLNDQRFSAVRNKPEFAIDPTHKQQGGAESRTNKVKRLA